MLALSGASFAHPTRVRLQSSRVFAGSLRSIAWSPIQGPSDHTVVVVGRLVPMRTWRVGLGVACLVVFLRLNVCATSAGSRATISGIARIRSGRNLRIWIRRNLPSSVAVRLMWRLRVSSVSLAPLRQVGKIRVSRAMHVRAKNLGVIYGTLPSHRRRSLQSSL